jgi:hypothetical protein
MSNFLESRKVRTVLFILSGLIAVFVAFGLGIAVGYERAGFAAGFDRNYYRIFLGGTPGAMGLMAPPVPMAMHGVVGTVIDIGTSTISVTDAENNERSVAVSSGTVIRDGDNDAGIANVKVGDMIAAIGEPNDQGQVAARFVRIIFAPSSTQN